MKKRILEFISHEKMTLRQFEKRVGFVDGFLLRNFEAFSNSELTKINLAFPILNLDWLRTGEGKMIVDSLNLFWEQ